MEEEKKKKTDTNMHLVESNRSAALRTLFTTYSKRMCLKSNSTQSVNTCKSSRSHHGGDFHTVKTQLLMPACLLFHSSVFAEALLLKGNSTGSDLFFFSFFWQSIQKIDRWLFGVLKTLNLTLNPTIWAIWRLKQIALFPLLLGV